jgi:hypothetical protein
MSWQTTIIPIVRGLVFDLTPPYTYCDTRLEELIVVSAVLVAQEVAFGTSYTMDLNAVTISPDPSDDEDFVALVSLRTACLIAQGEHRDAAKAAVSVKDGPSFVDTKDRAKHLGDLAEDACEMYTKAKVNYQIGDGSLGRAIVGPYNAGNTAEAGRRFN